MALSVRRHVVVASGLRVWDMTSSTTVGWCSQTTLLLEITPSLHGDLTRVKLTITTVTSSISLGVLASSLTSVTPREVVEVPEGIDWQNQVPDWKREQVDQHPEDVDWSVSSNNDQHTRQTKD